MKKIFSLGICIMLFLAAAQAQGPVITFDDKVHDFGKIHETDGLATFDFTFTNTGNAPLVINGVTASCGCTTPNWTREPIEPQGQGFIKVSYNPAGRPGAFTKGVTVRSNGSEASIALTIKGEVIPRKRAVEEDFPIRMGTLRMRTKSTPLFDMYKADTRVNRLKIKNMDSKDVTLSFVNVPSHIVIEAVPNVLKTLDEGEIIITYNAKDIDDYGVRTDYAYVVLNNDEKLTEEFRLTINSNLKEDFRKLTAEQKENAPVATFSEKSVNIELKPDSKKNVSIELTNTGNEPLQIRKVSTEKGIARATLKPTIAKGKSAQLKMEINTTGLKEYVISKVVVITNDPKNPTIFIPVNIKILN